MRPLLNPGLQLQLFLNYGDGNAGHCHSKPFQFKDTIYQNSASSGLRSLGFPSPPSCRKPPSQFRMNPIYAPPPPPPLASHATSTSHPTSPLHSPPAPYSAGHPPHSLATPSPPSSISLHCSHLTSLPCARYGFPQACHPYPANGSLSAPSALALPPKPTTRTQGLTPHPTAPIASSPSTKLSPSPRPRLTNVAALT